MSPRSAPEARRSVRVLLLAAAVALVAAAVGLGVGASAAQSADLDELAGNGTSEDPYVLTDAAELQAMEQDLDGHYVLGEDVDASETRYWNEGHGFEPVGSAEEPFAGTLDGNERAIRGLYVNRPNETVGVFGVLGADARVERVELANVTLNPEFSYDVAAGGGLAGRNHGEVRQVNVSGYLYAAAPSGGIVGYNDGTVAQSYSTIDVELVGDTAGLVGENDGVVRNSYAVIPKLECGGYGGCAGEQGNTVGDHANGTTENLYGRGVPVGALRLHSGLDREEVTGTDAIETMDGFDFQDTWRATPGFPVFAWQYDGPELDGVGTDEQPFRVAAADDLREVSKNRSANYVLESDVDASATAEWNNGTGHGPIGSTDEPFAGSFDGRQHAIANLTIDRPAETSVGLFGVVGGTVTNLSLRDADVTGDAAVGAVVGSNQGTVRQVRADGRVDGARSVGGIAGQNSGTVAISYANASVSGERDVGGLLGTNAAGTVSQALATGAVDGDETATTGGLVGDQVGGAVEAGYWDVETTGQGDSAGGTGLATDELTGDAARSSLSGLQFASPPTYDEPWVATDGYPVLAWEDVDPIGLDGSGTADDPYLIEDATDLSSIRADLDAHYVLVDDVDASETASWNDGPESGANGTSSEERSESDGGDGFEPIGEGSPAQFSGWIYEDGFRGTLDGDGHAIVGLTIDRREASEVGLFAAVASDGVVRNVTFEDVDVTGKTRTGAVAALSNGTVENVAVEGRVRALDAVGERGTHVGGVVAANGGELAAVEANATVSGDEDVGGVVGENQGPIEAARADGTVSGNDVVGGLVGDNGANVEGGAIVDSVATADVEGVGQEPANLGGLVGQTDGSIAESSAHGVVDAGAASRSVGGLVGDHVAGRVEATYARGAVRGGTNVGGLVGTASYETELESAFATGTVVAAGKDGSRSQGGLLGARIGGDASAVYWDANATGLAVSLAGTPLSTDELTGESASDALDGFDFADTWTTTDSYPELRGQPVDVERTADPFDDENRSDHPCELYYQIRDQTVCDVNGDGLYRDVTGDGSVGQTDVVEFFQRQHRDAWKRPELFDFTGNSEVGHGDVVALFEYVATR